MDRLPPLPITHAAAVTSVGRSLEETWANLIRGETRVARRQVADVLGKPGPKMPMGVVEAPKVTRSHPFWDTRLGRLANVALEPLWDAALGLKNRFASDRIGVIVGSCSGGIAHSEEAYAALAARQQPPQGYSFEATHALGALPAVLAADLGLCGPALTVSVACASGAKALSAAARLIAAGHIDAALVGGADSLCLTTLFGFQGLGLVSSGACRPFAADRDGMVLGEGAAFFLVERDAAAPVYLVGSGETSDAFHATRPHPEGAGARAAIAAALDSAAVDPCQIGYLNAHGTGTLANDDSEARAVTAAFAAPPWMSSTKGATGHLLGAAGAVEAAVCVRALETGVAPPNALGASTDLGLRIAQEPQPLPHGFALSNSFAFGGANVSLLLASHAEMERNQPHIAAVTARRMAGPGTARVGINSATVSAPVCLRAVALWSPTSGSAPEWLAGATRAVMPPPAEMVAARVRGRASVFTRSLAEVVGQLVSAGMDASRVGMVCGSAYGEVAHMIELMKLQAEHTSSPLRFQASVHNAGLGVVSMAAQNRGISTAIAAGERTVAMTLLEAMSWLHTDTVSEVAVVLADEASPEVLPSPTWAPLAAGLWLGRDAPSDVRPLGYMTVPVRREGIISSAQLEPPVGCANNPVAPVLGLVQAALQGITGRIPVGPDYGIRFERTLDAALLER